MERHPNIFNWFKCPEKALTQRIKDHGRKTRVKLHGEVEDLQEMIVNWFQRVETDLEVCLQFVDEQIMQNWIQLSRTGSFNITPGDPAKVTDNLIEAELPADVAPPVDVDKLLLGDQEERLIQQPVSPTVFAPKSA
jgi:hypothetical protein